MELSALSRQAALKCGYDREKARPGSPREKKKLNHLSEAAEVRMGLTKTRGTTKETNTHKACINMPKIRCIILFYHINHVFILCIL